MLECSTAIMGLFPPLYEQIVTILIYFAVIIHFVAADNNSGRLHFLVVLVGFLALSEMFKENFFLLQAILVGWLILVGTKMIVSKEILLIMLVILIVVSVASPWFFFITFLFYVIILGGFVFSAFTKLKKKFAKGL